MIARDWQHEQHVHRLVFDRDAIVRAAVRALVEGYVRRLPNCLSFAVADGAIWKGDLQRGALYNDNGEGDYEVIAWTEAGVVGLAFELGFGPFEQLGLLPDAVTGGPDDVRAAVPDLPDELEPAFVMAAGMLDTGPARPKGDTYVVYGERLAGVGFWLFGDRVAGSMFDDRTAAGANRLAAWGSLQRGRLPPAHSSRVDRLPPDRPQEIPLQALVDALTERALKGPTELTTDEIAMLLPKPPHPENLLNAQRAFEAVGIAWPGLPKLPAARRPTGRNPFLPPPTTVHRYLPRGGGAFDRDTLVRAALHAYAENILAKLDPLGRHPFPVCDEPRWTGDLKRGAFFNGVASGDYDVVAWMESGVIGLTYKVGFGPIEHLGLSPSAVTGGPDDVRAALPDLPAEMEPALEMATRFLGVGSHGERLAGLGFWLHGNRVEGNYFDAPTTAPAFWRMSHWATLGVGTLRVTPDPNNAAVAGNFALWTCGPILDLVDAVTDRAMAGPTELTAAELDTLLPTPPDPSLLLIAQRMLQEVGITWPGSPEIPEAPRPTGNPFLPQAR